MSGFSDLVGSGAECGPGNGVNGLMKQFNKDHSLEQASTTFISSRLPVLAKGCMLNHIVYIHAMFVGPVWPWASVVLKAGVSPSVPSKRAHRLAWCSDSSRLYGAGEQVAGVGIFQLC